MSRMGRRLSIPILRIILKASSSLMFCCFIRRPLAFSIRARSSRRCLVLVTSWRILAISLAAAAVASGAATYATLAGSKSFDDSPAIVLLLLNVDLVLSLLLAFLIARRIVAVWSERRKGSAGSRLHVKLVVWFGLVSVVPAIVVGVFSVSFFNFGVESWFSERVRTALNESRAAAEIYLKEHKRNIRADATAMANDLNRDAIIVLQNNPKRLNEAIKIYSG